MSTALDHATLDEVVAVVAGNAAAHDAAASFPVAALRALRRGGLLGLLVPVEFGGRGGGLADMVDVTVRLSRSDMSVGMIFSMHCQQVAALVRYGAADLRARVLPEIARGDRYLGSVTTEAGRGGGALLTSASPVQAADGRLHIDRHAPIVTGGEYADAFLVTVQAPEAIGPHQVSLVYAERAQLTVETLGGWESMGMRATRSVPMRLRGAVPQSQVVGEPGGFREVVTQLFGPMAHLGWSAAWLGTAAGALSRVVAHIRTPEGRRQFDTRSELLLDRLGRIRGRLEATHALLRHTVGVVAGTEDLSAPPVQLLINTLKTNAAEQCFAAVHELVELVGLRHGYLPTSGLGVERAFRDLRSASLNFANDRLHRVNGSLALLDPEVRLG